MLRHVYFVSNESIECGILLSNMFFSERKPLPAREQPSVLRAESGTFRVAPPPGAVIEQIRRQSQAAVEKAGNAYAEPANDNADEELVELSSDDLVELPGAVDHEVFGATDTSGVFSIKRNQDGRVGDIIRESGPRYTDPKIEQKRITAESKSLMNEINERVMALNRLDRELADAHDMRLWLTPIQHENPKFLERIRDLDKKIVSIEEMHVKQEQGISFLEGRLRKIVDASRKKEVVPNVQPRQPEKAPVVQEHDRVAERNALIEQGRQASQQITREGIQSEALANELSNTMARAQKMQMNVDKIKKIIQQESGFFKRMFNGSRRAELDAQLRDQESEAALANAAYKTALESIAAHNRFLDGVYASHDSIMSRLAEIDRAGSDQRLAA